MYILAYILLTIATVSVAVQRGRSWAAWLALGLIIPGIALIAVLVMPDLREVLAKLQAQAIQRPCPFCREPIRKDACKCKHCGSDVEPMPLPTVAVQENL